jgi:hypothetical protein
MGASTRRPIGCMPSIRRIGPSTKRTSTLLSSIWRGALYLLQGVLQCLHCVYACYGQRLSPSARQGKPRAYAYYRCLGTDAYRFGGERICQNTPVRTDLLDLAVWKTLWPNSMTTWQRLTGRASATSSGRGSSGRT